jgi:hypothetical protein
MVNSRYIHIPAEEQIVLVCVNTDPYLAEDTDELKWLKSFLNSKVRVLFVEGLNITVGHGSFA